MNDQCHIHAKQLRNNTFDSFPGPKAIPVKPNEYYVNEDYAQTDDRWKKDEILAAKIKKFLSVSYVLCGHVTLGNHVVTTQPRGDNTTTWLARVTWQRAKPSSCMFAS